MEFKYPNNSFDLARGTVQAIHKDAKLFFTDAPDPRITRFELSLKSLNNVLSGKYWGPKSGFALGKLYNFFGPESSGKSALALQIQADIIHNNGRAVWVDAERSLDEDYIAEAYMVDVYDKTVFEAMVPDYGEQAFDGIKAFAEAQACSLITVDSVSALGTKRTQEANAEKADVASLALKLGQHLQTIVKPANDSKCAIIYINQLRTNLQMGGAFGNKYTGGWPMKFYPHVALEFRRGDQLTSGNEIVGSKTKVTAVKNKVGKPHRFAELIMIAGEGFSVELDIHKLAVESKVVEQKGNWYYYKGQAVGNGLNQCRLKLKEHPEMLQDIWNDTKYVLQPAGVDESTGEVISEKPVEQTLEEAVGEVPEKKSRGRKKKEVA